MGVLPLFRDELDVAFGELAGLILGDSSPLDTLICSIAKGTESEPKNGCFISTGDNMGDWSTDELLRGKGVELREEFSVSETPVSVLLFDR